MSPQADKLCRLQEKKCFLVRPQVLHKARTFLSLIGLLQRAATVTRPGWSFVHRIILSSSHKHIETCICLNREFWSGLEWWFQLAAAWNGISILALLKAENPCGNSGCEAFSSGEWFQLQRDSSMTTVHITKKELIPGQL